MKKVPSILVALQLAYQNGRDCYTGILQYLATERRHWNICLVRGALTSAILKREVCNDINGVIMECAGHYSAADAERYAREMVREVVGYD